MPSRYRHVYHVFAKGQGFANANRPGWAKDFNWWRE
jgi:hypothetical protein